MTTKFNIRHAHVKDWKSIQALNRQIFQFELETCEPTSNLQYPDSSEGIEYYKKSSEQRDGHYAIVAEQGSAIIGYAIIKLIDHSDMTHRTDIKMAQLHTLAVDEQYRDKGIGRKLIEASKRQAKELGANRLKVTAYAPNSRARHLYRTCGFCEHEITHEITL